MAAALMPAAAWADVPVRPQEVWREWSFEPGVLCCLGLASLLYLLGARASRGTTGRQMLWFWGGMAALVVALISPVDAMGEALFSAHMTQHELLMLAAAPALVLAEPAAALLWGLPRGARRAMAHVARARVFRRTFGALTQPLHAWWLHAAALWIWHAPRLFEATLRNEWVHTAQHLCFFGSALCFWWALFETKSRAEYGLGVLYVFTTAIHTGILGALLTFSPHVVYPIYSRTAPLWGLTALQDQQIGGLIMWLPAGILYMAAGLALFWMWLQRSGRSGAALARSRYAE